MGPFPPAIKQLKFLVVGIDYFTKWVEAEALTTITKKNIRSFVWKNIICRYGICLWQRKAVWQQRILGLLFGARDQEPLFVTRPLAGQWTGWGYESILVQDHQDSARGGKGHLTGGISKRFMGIPDNSKNTHRENTVLTNVGERSSYPNRSWTYKLQGGQPWWAEEWRGYAPRVGLTRQGQNNS